MKSFRHRLPPLTSLLVFEAAARLESFTAAAAELHVTQAAVSKQVRQLEEFTGLELFERHGRRVRLSHAGDGLYQKVSASLIYLADGIETMTGKTGSRPEVTVAANAAVSQFWLGEALNAFHRQHRGPVPNIRIITSDYSPDQYADDVDIAVVYDPGNRLDWSVTRLFAEEMFPVASPDYLALHPVEAGRDFAAAEHVLLDFERLEPNWINWGIWLEKMGLPGSAGPQYRRFNSYMMVVDSALRGQGVALGTSVLLDGLLAEGRLVPASSRRLRSGRDYCLALNRKSAGSDAVDYLHLWLSGYGREAG